MRLARSLAAAAVVLCCAACGAERIAAPRPGGVIPAGMPEVRSLSDLPVFIVDGKLLPPGTPLGLSGAEIAAVEVLKGPAASALYGAVAKRGAVRITTNRAQETSGHDGHEHR